MVTRILAHYPQDIEVRAVNIAGNGRGFSGASIWKLETSRGELCLRRWPREHPNVERLQFIHSVQLQAASSGLPFVPQPITTRHGTSFVESDDGYLWELTEWMPGSPSLAPPLDLAPEERNIEHGQSSLLAMATRNLAEFHRAVELPSLGATTTKSPGLKARLNFCHQLLAGELQQTRQAIQRMSSIYHDELATIVVLASPRIAGLSAKLQTVADDVFSIQPCLRDIWYEHVLFHNRNVSGIIDFGAVALDTVATDIARLLTSVEGHITDGWEVGVEEYAAARPLSRLERTALPIFREANILLSGFNWIRWLLIEERHFENEAAVRNRLRAIVDGLDR